MHEAIGRSFLFPLVDPQRVFLSGSEILPLPAHVLNVNLTNALSENAETVIKNETMTRAALSAPRFGLSWSNPNAKEDVLLRNALLQGRFYAILESSAVDGLPFIREQIRQLRDSGDINEGQVGKLERMLMSIERGFAEAAAERPS